jgi:hypothetical protein
MQDQQTFGFLLTYLMDKLEVDPDHVFTLEDLKDRAESEIQPLVEAGYLIPCAGMDGTAATFNATVEPMVREIRALRHLKGSGAPKQLDPRLFYLGTWTMKAEVYSWFLALVTSTKQLSELMTKKAQRYLAGERVVIVTPGFADPTAPDNLGISYPTELLTLGALGLVKIRDESVRKQLLSKSLNGPPSEVEKDIEEFGLRFRCKVDITGNIERKNLNVVLVDNVKICMGDPLFILLLTLMLQQFRKPGGYIKTEKLAEAEVLHQDTKEKAVSALRTLLRRAVRETRLLIQADGDGALRISVHETYFRVDTALLLEHKNSTVRDLAIALKKEGVQEPERRRA